MRWVGLAREASEGLHAGSCSQDLVRQVLMDSGLGARCCCLSLSCGLVHALRLSVRLRGG